MKLKSRLWQIQLAALLLLATVAFYLLRWQLFPTAVEHREMLRYIVGDVAFLFLQVLLVTVVIDGVTQHRQKEDMKRKLNMVVGAFFSQAGTELLGQIASTDATLGEIRELLVARASWKPEDYRYARLAFASHEGRIDLGSCDLVALRNILGEQKPYILGLLGNQSLLEHEQFTDLLWAVTHLAEELVVRPELTGLPASDLAHLTGDTKRAYLLLGTQWLDYLAHLQTNYPYLFSLALRTNPLDPEATVVVSA
ncbi:MAG: hypothetical protein CVT67_10550 [Actinobacteria bacterium HGW-Actinobacteria-7]|jgi:hypothetical protein|nr:MAG: hypothetical protein CVT67_10550 [Actinobacteria bacterium HGW-Actinobacteria-7]